MCIFVSFTSVIPGLDWISHRLRIIFVKRNDFEMFELRVANERAHARAREREIIKERKKKRKILPNICRFRINSPFALIHSLTGTLMVRSSLLWMCAFNFFFFCFFWILFFHSLFLRNSNDDLKFLSRDMLQTEKWRKKKFWFSSFL